MFDKKLFYITYFSTDQFTRRPQTEWMTVILVLDYYNILYFGKSHNYFIQKEMTRGMFALFEVDMFEVDIVLN